MTVSETVRELEDRVEQVWKWKPERQRSKKYETIRDTKGREKRSKVNLFRVLEQLI